MHHMQCSWNKSERPRLNAQDLMRRRGRVGKKQREKRKVCVWSQTSGVVELPLNRCSGLGVERATNSLHLIDSCVIRSVAADHRLTKIRITSCGPKGPQTTTNAHSSLRKSKSPDVTYTKAPGNSVWFFFPVDGCMRAWIAQCSHNAKQWRLLFLRGGDSTPR